MHIITVVPTQNANTTTVLQQLKQKVIKKLIFSPLFVLFFLLSKPVSCVHIPKHTLQLITSNNHRNELDAVILRLIRGMWHAYWRIQFPHLVHGVSGCANNEDINYRNVINLAKNFDLPYRIR